MLPSRYLDDVVLTRAVWGWLVALGVAYAAVLGSPLRLVEDAAVYLMQSMGGEMAAAASPRAYPPGYSGLLQVLRATGVPMPAAVVGANLLALGVGAWAAGRLLRESAGLDAKAARWAVAVLLSSIAVIKNAPLPMPDVIAAAGSWGVLALLVHVRPGRRRAVGLLLGAIVLAGAVTGLRTVGVLLLFPLAVTAWRLLRTSARGKVAAGAVAIGGGTVAIVALGDSFVGYAGEWLANLGRYGLGTLTWNAEMKLKGVAELAFNVPLHFIGGPSLLWVVVGAVLLGGVLSGMWRVRKRAPEAHVFVLAHLLLLAVWASKDERFWLPILPLLIGYAWAALQAAPPLRRLMPVVLAGFFLTGGLAHGYALWQMAPPERFPERYGRGMYERPFEAFCQGGTLEPAPDFRTMNRYRIWLVLRADQRPLVPALSPCPDGPPRSSTSAFPAGAGPTR